MSDQIVPEKVNQQVQFSIDPMDEILERHSKSFQQICRGSHELFERKNRQYRAAIRHTGVLGASVELVGLAARLMALVIKNPLHGADQRDALIDIAKDAHNYANILLIHLAENNWDGID